MTPLEAMPIVIAVHRQYLQNLTDPRALPDLSPSWRERLGARIVRLGQWVASTCPDVAVVPARDLSRA